MNCCRSAHEELQSMGQQIETELPDSQPVSQSNTQSRHDEVKAAELNAQLMVIKVNPFLFICFAPDMVLSRQDFFPYWYHCGLQGITDLICAVNMPGVGLPRLFLGHPLNDGIIGMSGVISALITLRNQWPPASTLPK